MISIIIPTYNEETHILSTINYLLLQPGSDQVEILVVDGGSHDRTIELVMTTSCSLLISPLKGRAIQMNYGATFAKGDIFYFLHADCRPPLNFITLILHFHQQGRDSGCFYLKFDHPHWFINTIAQLTRLNFSFIRFGDQSLFISKLLFAKIGGYDEQCIVMEDHEIIKRIQRVGSFKVIPGFITTSARKFLENGPYKLMCIYLYIYLLYYLKIPQSILLKQYRALICNGKL